MDIYLTMAVSSQKALVTLATTHITSPNIAGNLCLSYVYCVLVSGICQVQV